MIKNTAEVKADKQILKASLLLIGSIIAFGLMLPDSLYEAGNTAMSYISEKYGWIYAGGTFAFVVSLFWLAFSKYGDIRLGPNNGSPGFCVEVIVR